MTAIRSRSLVPDCGGLIRTIALALPASFFAADGPDNIVSSLVPIGNLLSVLPRDVATVILIDRISLEPAQNWLDRLEIRSGAVLAPIHGNTGVSHPWIQDMFHVRTSGEAAVELVMTAANAVADALADCLELAATVTDVVLPGGNQLVGPDFRLVGHSSLQDDRGFGRSILSNRSERRQQVQSLDDKTVHSFGYRPEDLGNASAWSDPSIVKASAPAILGGKMHQCGFHVDQFVSVTGLNRDGHPLLLVADPVAPGDCASRAVMELKRKLDASALSLAGQGFAILRNPIPILPAIDTNKCLPRLYNNVFLENVTRSGQKRPFVWVPHFGDTEMIEDFDKENRHIWESLGFHVIGVAGWSHLASRNGALRCATKVINRDPV